MNVHERIEQALPKASTDVLIVTAVRNEAPYLIEWIAHNLRCGARKFLIFSNHCEDHTDQLLSALHAAGIITHVPFDPDPERSIQWQAFRSAWKHDLRKEADWALVCDVDEFVNIRTEGHDFDGLINALPKETDAVALGWRNFGAAGPERDLKTPVLQDCTGAATLDQNYPISNTLFKTLFRLDGPFNQFGIHRPSQKRLDRARPPIWVDGAGRHLPLWFATNPQRLSLFETNGGRSLADLHHYSLRSNREFILKRHRGLPNRRDKEIDLHYWVERNFNSVTEDALVPISQDTQSLRDALLTLPGVDDAYQKGLLWHESAFDRLLQNEANQRLYAATLLAGDSVEMTAQQGQALYERYRQMMQGRDGGSDA